MVAFEWKFNQRQGRMLVYKLSDPPYVIAHQDGIIPFVLAHVGGKINHGQTTLLKSLAHGGGSAVSRPMGQTLVPRRNVAHGQQQRGVGIFLIQFL